MSNSLADRDLSEENTDALNAEFYRNRPYEYFEHRFGHLALVAHKDESLFGLLDDGYHIGGLSLDFPDRDSVTYTDSDAESARRFVSLEAQVLWHHTVETLLRLYIAHVGQPEVPWLTLSRVRHSSSFEKSLDRHFDETRSSERHEEIAQVFYGTTLSTDLDVDIAQDQWNEWLRTIDRFLRRFDRQLRDGKHLYNAAKHGLAVHAGPAAVTISDNDEPVASRGGMALSYLEVTSGRWHHTSTWLETELCALDIYVALKLMKQLWTVGRHRYTSSQHHQTGWSATNWKEGLHDIIDQAQSELMGDGPVKLKSLSRQLLYDSIHEDEKQATNRCADKS